MIHFIKEHSNVCWFYWLFICLFVPLCLVVGFKSLHLFSKSICQSLLCLQHISLSKLLLMVVMPNSAFLVCAGDISGEFGLVMICILTRSSPAQILMVRPNKPDILRSVPRRVWLSVYSTHKLVHIKSAAWYHWLKLIHQIFLLTQDWSKRDTWQNIPT